ncbi:MAG TPA: hypothetical protein VH350_19965 [Candidatus Sulfotelmatobacter sp.]|nr:hypothetical protein [Candidatus Sulfotelmatobacter sp.]
MRKLIAVGSMWWILTLVAPAYAQQVDLSFGGGALSAPNNTNTFSGANESLSGGTYVGFGGDALIKKHLGFEAEVFWRTSQGLYQSQVPFRPVFYDFNAIYVKQFSKRVAVEALAGIGAESLRFYQGGYNCDAYGNCSNYVSSNHFMGDFGGGIKLYAWKNLFVRPEARLYLIKDNVEFNSSFAVRYGASVGYTFGGSR